MYTKTEHAAYMRDWYAQRRKDWIDSQGGKCVACGTTENLGVDHVDPDTKLYNPSEIWMRSDEVRVSELAKCQVLCEPCHLAKSIGEVAVPHGGGKSGKRNCRCDACRIKKNEYLKLLKRERRARGLKD